jgi:hypothetical protein
LSFISLSLIYYRREDITYANYANKDSVRLCKLHWKPEEIPSNGSVPLVPPSLFAYNKDKIFDLEDEVQSKRRKVVGGKMAKDKPSKLPDDVPAAMVEDTCSPVRSPIRMGLTSLGPGLNRGSSVNVPYMSPSTAHSYAPKKPAVPLKSIENRR